MSDAPRGVLLDTHILIWHVQGGLDASTIERLASAGAVGGLLVSPITAWEIGLLCGSRRLDRPSFDPDPARWYELALRKPGMAEAPFSGAIALAAAFLPGDFHKDPADRMLVATARTLDVPLATHDRKILAYAEAGHLKAIAC